MRNLLILLVISNCIVSGIGRPPLAQAEDREDALEYEVTDDEADSDDSNRDADPKMNEQEVAEEAPDEESDSEDQGENEKVPAQHNGDNENQSMRDFKGDISDKTDRNQQQSDTHDQLREEDANEAEDPSSLLHDSHGRVDTSDSNDQPEANRNLNNYREYDDNLANKRTIKSHSILHEGERLFENISKERRNQANTGELSSGRNQARFNSMRDYKGTNYERYDRDRREASNSPINTSTAFNKLQETGSNDLNIADDEEAIKRHVKKLSSEELQELLASLSVDKRELLKKIMENNGYDMVKKREIGNGSGAFSENSGLSKLQEDSSTIDTLTQFPESKPISDATTLPDTQTDVSDINLSKTSKIDENVLNKDNNLGREDEDSLKQSENSLSSNSPLVCSNVEVTTKVETKREIRGEQNEMEVPSENDFGLIDFEGRKNYDEYLSEPEESLSDLVNDENQLHSDTVIHKRETITDDSGKLSASMKTLEESFPNSNSFDSQTRADLKPLVRVKRRTTVVGVKKRAAALMPEANVAYFPYRAENEDQDSDEGNEFDDDGFYDRTSNFAKGDRNQKQSHFKEEPISELTDSEHSGSVRKSGVREEDNTKIVGSDTDGVLSGVDVVDENLMLNSDSRNRRTVEDKQVDDNIVRSTPAFDGDGKFAANYQENDAFGALPHNYEGELGRYKRIRRVKQDST